MHKKDQNPFTLRNPIMKWTWQGMKKEALLFDSYKIEIIGEFERNTLIPQMINRLDVFEDFFKKVIKVCEDPGVAKDLDSAISHVVSPSLAKFKLSPTPVGVQYLQGIKNIIEKEYIDWIKEIKINHPQESITTVDRLIAFLNELSYLSSSIERTKSKLFYYHIGGFPIIKDIETGKEYVSPPHQLKVILIPFETTINELQSIANAVTESIKSWHQNRLERKKDFLTFTSNLSQYRAATALNVFQLLVIIFTLTLFFSSDVITLRFNNHLLSKHLEDAKQDQEQLTKEIKAKDQTIEFLQKQSKDLLETLNKIKNAKNNLNFK